MSSALKQVVETVAEKVATPPVPVLRIDLHCHSEASHDCVTPIEEIPQRLIARGIHVQAITDHDQIWGALKLKELVASNPEWSEKLIVIVGEEISTSEGEIIGLFLSEKIEPGLSPEATVAEIKRQGGLVSIPHGFDPLKRHRLRPAARERIAKEIDIIEVFNARISRVRWNEEAGKWAHAHGKQMSAGSDSHTWADLGCCASESEWPGRELPKEEPREEELVFPTVEVPATEAYSPFHTAAGFTRRIETPADLLAALTVSKVNGRWTHPVWAFALKSLYWLKQLGRPRVRR